MPARRSLADRSAVVQLARQGMRASAIMRATKLPKDFVIYWMHHPTPSGSVADLPRSSGKKVVTPAVKQRIRRMMKDKPNVSIRSVADRLNASGVKISKSTVGRVAHDANLRPYRRPPKPKQHRGDKAKRLRFVDKYKDHDWKCTWYGDEKRFTTYSRSNRKNDIIWTDIPSKVPHSDRVAHPISINAYAAFSLDGYTDIHLFEESMTAERYINILQDVLLPATSAVMGDRTWCYLQDSDPKHRARATIRFLDEHVPEYIPPGDWPPRSPDLNPMENVWALLAKRVRLSNPQTKQELKREIRAAWRHIMTDELRQHMVESMPHRFRLVRKGRGHITKY